MKITPINKGFLLIGITIVFILTLITYFPWEDSNYNGLPDSFLAKIPIKIFEVLTLPGYLLHRLFGDVENLFFIILFPLLNIFLYGLVIERALTISINKIKSK